MLQKFPVRPTFSVPLRLLLCIILIAGVGFFTVIAHHLTRVRVNEQSDTAFAKISDSYVRQLSQRMEGYGDLLYATRGLFATSPVTAVNWEQFITAQYTFERYSGMKVIAYAEIVPESKRNTYTARVQNETQDSTFVVHPVSKASEHIVITYLQEDTRGGSEYKGALGFDLTSETIRKQTLERARIGGRIAASAPLSLVESKKPGFLLVLPLATTSGTEGYSVAAFDVADLIEKTIGADLEQARTSLKITDVSEREPQALYTKQFDVAGPTVTQSIIMNVADRKWQLELQSPEHQLLKGADRYAATAVLFGGVIIILSLAIGLYSLRIRHQLKCSITS